MTAPVTPVVVRGPAELAEAAAAWPPIVCGRRGAARRLLLALAGGETPRGCYAHLAQPPYSHGLPWASVFVFWSDERQVPSDRPATNAMAKAALLDHVPIRPIRSFRWSGPDAGPSSYSPNEHGWLASTSSIWGWGRTGTRPRCFQAAPPSGGESARGACAKRAETAPGAADSDVAGDQCGRAVLVMVQGASKKTPWRGSPPRSALTGEPRRARRWGARVPRRTAPLFSSAVLLSA